MPLTEQFVEGACNPIGPLVRYFNADFGDSGGDLFLLMSFTEDLL